MNIMSKVVIIGGGAAGLMAAVSAAEHNKDADIVIIERNSRPARKVMITGKGRCNVTNNCDVSALLANVPRNSRFLYSAFNAFSSFDTMQFFENLNVPLKTERGNRVFPVSDKAVDIVDALVKKALRKAKLTQGRAKAIICDNKQVRAVKLDDGRVIEADSVVLATGGMSYPLTGSSGDGYIMAKVLGHTVTELSPSLIDIRCHEGFCTNLAGLSLKNVVFSVFYKGKKKPIFKELGEMLFTHTGISGPLVLSATSYMGKGNISEYEMFIDFKPALAIEQLDKRILRDFSESLNSNFSNSLDKLLPRSLIPVMVRLSKIPADLKVNQISKEQRESLVRLIKNFPLTPTDFGDINAAIITRGGINVKEIDPATMQSKIINGLYFAGEIIDVDAVTGGFNLQIAFSTGYLAGKNSVEDKGE